MFYFATGKKPALAEDVKDIAKQDYETLKKQPSTADNNLTIQQKKDNSFTFVSNTKDSSLESDDNSLKKETEVQGSSNTDESISKTQDIQIAKWTVKEVCTFVADLLGTDEYNEDFTSQEIDGSALILLKEKHLVNAMNMKLGPALKIVAKVQSLLSTTVETSVQQP